MKKLIIFISIASLTLLIFSCEKENKENVDFFKLEDRMGKWVNAARRDTLHFVNDSVLKRYYSGEHDYRYRINNNSMFVRLPNTQIESQHIILESDDTHVKLESMYQGFEETINYGIFIKMD
jgi:lipocalin